MNTPLVSVVIPTYNRASLIGRTIDNVFEQTYSNLEVLVVDDGSTDNTPGALQRFGDRIRIITQRNTGPAVARNRGARAARGEIIAFQDSDDLWKPAKLARQVHLLTKFDDSVPCCLCNAAMESAAGKTWTSFDDSLMRLPYDEGLWLNVAEVLASRFVLFNQCVAIRRNAFERLGGFREDLRYLEDYDLPLRLSMEGPWAFVREPMVLYGSNSPESFSQHAQRNRVLLRKCAVDIVATFLTDLDRRHGSARLRRLAKHRLRMLRVMLLGAQLEQSGSLMGRAAGRLLMSGEHYVSAAFRRSPWFPEVVTAPCNQMMIECPGLSNAV